MKTQKRISVVAACLHKNLLQCDYVRLSFDEDCTSGRLHNLHDGLNRLRLHLRVLYRLRVRIRVGDSLLDGLDESTGSGPLGRSKTQTHLYTDSDESKRMLRAVLNGPAWTQAIALG